MGDLLISYDEGVSSTGWSVWNIESFEPKLIATGDVDYPTDDCLASKRRQLCHLRRSIRSRKQCIEQLAKLFLNLNLLSTEEINTNRVKTRALDTHPWFLAARVLAATQLPETERTKHLLTAAQLWDVLRWYAHNRGYYVPWAGYQDSDEDTRKVSAAKALRDFYGKKWMAETCCAVAGVLDPLNPPKKFSGGFVGAEFKGKNAGKQVKEVPSFPRDEILMPEVTTILEAHKSTLGKDLAFKSYSFEKFVAAIVSDWKEIPSELRLFNKEKNDRSYSPEQKAKNKTKIWLPSRYSGGLLFGQRIPRFNNRIISACPKTKKKTPLKQCREFYDFRWAMFVANIKAGENAKERKPLSKQQRIELDGKMRVHGFLTPEQLIKAVKEITGFENNNIKEMFTDTPESEKSLIVQPVDRLFAAKKELAHYLHPVLPSNIQKNLRNQLWRGKRIKVSRLLEKVANDCEAKRKIDEAIDRYIHVAAESSKDEEPDEIESVVSEIDQQQTTEAKSRKRSKPRLLKREDVLNSNLYVAPLTGRAPYSKEILIQAKDEVFGKDSNVATDPRKYSREQLKREGKATPRLEKAEDKPAHGCLAGIEEISATSLGIEESEQKREAKYQQWRTDWIRQLNKRGEDLNRRRAEKYGESWVRRQYETRQLEKWLAAKSNNHLVRQRMLILDRLTQDIINEFAGGDSKRIGRIAIEVARDLVTFSGLTSKQRGGDDKGVMGSIRAQHRRVKAKLERDLKGTKWEHKVGKLLWKAKIADDLDWRCPYTGIEYCPCDLASGKMDIDHIIPKSVRLTNSMYAVVITFKAINQLKGARTARGFIKWAQEQGGKRLSELLEKKCSDCAAVNRPDGTPSNVEILSDQRFMALVSSLKTGSYNDSENPIYLHGTQRFHPDYKGRKQRIRYLKIVEYNKDNDAFTSRQLTNTSYLNRLAQSVLLRRLPHLGDENVVSIPGQVTKPLRDSGGWDLFSCLGHNNVCGDAATRLQTYKDENGNVVTKRVPLPKEELRKLTHLHHAVDACALGLIAHCLPKHGKLWEWIALGELTEAEKQQYDSLVKQFAAGELDGGQRIKPCDLTQFLTCYKIDDGKSKRSPDPDRIYRLETKRTPDAKARMCRIRDQISRELAKKRVVQHIPAEHAGLPTDETIYRVVNGVEGNGTVVRLVREQIERQRHKVADLEKPLRELETKRDTLDREVEAITNKTERNTARKDRLAERKLLTKAIEAARNQFDAERAMLETMENFKSNAWMIKKVRVGSEAWKDIKKRYDKISAVSEKAVGDGGEVNRTDAESDANNKTKKPPKLLGTPNLEKDKMIYVWDTISRSKLISLKSIKASKEIGTNFGIAILDNVPDEREKFVAIPWHKVWPRIYGPNGVSGEKPLIHRNGGKAPRILRVGTLIRLKNTKDGKKDGIWMVRSAQGTLRLNLSHVDLPTMKDSGRGIWREVPLSTLGAENIEILPKSLVGTPHIQ